MTDGKMLRELREAAGLDVIEGLAGNRVARIEDGRAQIRPEDVDAYRAATGAGKSQPLEAAAQRVRVERAERELRAAAAVFEEAAGRPASDVIKPPTPKPVAK